MAEECGNGPRSKERGILDAFGVFSNSGNQLVKDAMRIRALKSGDAQRVQAVI